MFAGAASKPVFVNEKKLAISDELLAISDELFFKGLSKGQSLT